jgi:PhnB protein
VPDGYGTVTPWIISRGTAQLIDFVTRAFDGTETARVPNDDGTIGHAEVRIGDSVVMMFDGRPGWPDTPAFLFHWASGPRQQSTR